MTTPWEKAIRSDKGEFLVMAHVDDSGYPVVTVIPHPEDGFRTVASDVSADGVERALLTDNRPVTASSRVRGQLQATFCPV